MVQFTLDTDNGLATISPNEDQALTADDFKAIAVQLDEYLQSNDTLSGLIIDADKFPGWASFEAFVAHMKFLRGHLGNIKKVAVVSDSLLLSTVPSVANIFASSRVQRFPVSRRAEAEEWASTVDPRPGRFVVLDGFPDDVLALKAEGRLTSADYEETLIPLAKAKIEAEGKIKLLYWGGEEFNGFSVGAAWDDTRFGLSNLGEIAKLAMVTDIGWIKDSVKLFAKLMPTPVRVFSNDEFEAAKAWIIENEATTPKEKAVKPASDIYTDMA